tara:strand:- start:2226 stop:4715 length:2490 start_codon:yes stop_codon:yes gene_type:complete
MPKLTSYTRQLTPSGGQNVISATPEAFGGGLALAQAGAVLADTAQDVGFRIKAVSDKRDAVAIEKSLIDGGLEMDAFRLELEKNAAPGGAGHTEAMRTEYARWSEGFKESYTNVSPENQGRLELGLARQRAGQVSASMRFEAASTAKKVREDVEVGLGTVRNQIGDGSATYEDGLNAGTSLIVAGLSGDLQQAALNDWRNDAADAHFQGLLRAANTPEAVMAVKGDLSDLQDQMDADTYASALNKIDASHDLLLRERDTDIADEAREQANLRTQGHAGNGLKREDVAGISDPRKRRNALEIFDRGEAIGVFADQIADKTPVELEKIEASLVAALDVEGNDLVEAGQLGVLRSERVRRAHAQDELGKRMPGILATIADGEYTPETVASAHEEIDNTILNVDDRGRMHKVLDIAEGQGAVRNAVPGMSEMQIAEAGVVLQKAVEDAAPQNLDLAVEQLRAYTEARRVRDAQLKVDSVKYAAANDPSTQFALERLNAAIGTEDEGAARAAYIATTIAAQERLGVDDPKVLTQLEVEGVADAVSAIGEDDTAGENLTDLLSGYSSTYGKNWPLVYKQLITGKALTGDHVALARIAGDVRKGAASRNLGTAIFNRKANEGSLGSKATKDVEDATTAVFNDTALTFNVAGAAATGNLYKGAVSTLALHYASLGKSADDAAKKAYEELLGSDFATVTTSTDAYRVPRTYPDGQPISEFMVARGAAVVKQNLLPYNLTPTVGLPPEEKAKSLAAFGQWVTAPDGSGLMLMSEQGEPIEALSPVAGLEGPSRAPFVVSWEELTTSAETFTGLDTESFPDLEGFDPNASLGSMLRTFAR